MSMKHRMMAKLLGLMLLVTGLSAGSDRNRIQEQKREDGKSFRTVSVADCSYSQNPDRYLYAVRRLMEDLSTTTERVARQTAPSGMNNNSEPERSAFIPDVPHRNFIDDYIFDKMNTDNIPHAPLCTDEEFLRRVTLDLTGRILSASDVRSFLNNDDPNKRSNQIKTLIGSSTFVDKWTMYYGDLLKNTQQDTNVTRYPEGRNAFYNTIKDAVQTNMPYDVFVKKIIKGAGDSYTVGEANWAVGGTTPMGPAQDTYDTLWVRTATEFLGLGNFDCLLCHNGAGHLDKVNLWGASILRSQAWEMSAFFARTRMTRVPQGTGQAVSYNVTDATTGDYALNTTSGNRTSRQPDSTGATTVKPFYFFATPQAAGNTYREMLANNLVKDRQFARATVNYLWKQMMGMGIVEPADLFDLDRLDPSNPPSSDWTIQPSHPELLEALTDDFVKSSYDVNHMLSLIANSSSYQLSSRFPGEWKEEYTAYFARKFVRRLWAEETHDAITKATGIAGSYTVTGITSPITWAMQLPDTQEPRSNFAVRTFLDYFLRGNRDNSFRSGDATILQALNMMNNTFVTTRIKNSNANTTVAKLLADKANTDDQLIEELFLSALSRFPTALEKSAAKDALKSNRTAGAENVQWVLLNKVDFLYNY